MTNFPARAQTPVHAAAAPGIAASVGLRPADLQWIAAAIDAEVAQSTRTTYASAWRGWEAWCRRRGPLPLPADPDALAAYLTERAESGLCNGTLDGDCAAIAHRHHRRLGARRREPELLTHQYDEINRELTWLTLSRDLPEWKRSLGALFDVAEAVIREEAEGD